MLKVNKKCNVCIAVQADDKLFQKIFKTNHYLKASDITLMDLWKAHEEKFSYRGLLSHVKNHQFMSEADYNERHMRQLARKAEKQVLQQNIDSHSVWDEVMKKGMQALESGEVPVKTADLLKAAKDKSDFDFKAKDQEMAFAEMMYFFASGENQTNLRKPYDSRRVVEGAPVQDINPAEVPAGHSDSGEDGPGSVYYPPTWNAASFGPGQVPAGNDPA